MKTERDFNVEMVAAGTVAHSNNTTAKACFDWDYYIPFYKRTLLEPIDDVKDIGPEQERIRKMSHGVKMVRKESAVDVLAPNNLDPILYERELMREQMYHRKEHKPLGKSGLNIVLPPFTKQESFRFGKLTHKDLQVSKIMYPIDDGHEETKSAHGRYKPGEQKRHYGKEWCPPEYKDSVESKRLDNDGHRVQSALYWMENRRRELEQQIISANLASFQSRHQPEIGKVFDPIKDTMSHIPPDHTFGIKDESCNFHVCDLMGTPLQQIKVKRVWKNNDERPAAGLQTHHSDDLDLQKHIVPLLGPKEDHSLVRKITEDGVGGTSRPAVFDKSHVFGVPTVRDPAGRIGKVKRLADKTNYGDELGAKGLMYPTPRNVYGKEQLLFFEQQLAALKQANLQPV